VARLKEEAMQGIDPSTYSPAVAELLQGIPLAPLGPGTPEPSVRARLEALDDSPFGGRIADQDMAACCRAGLWLAFNYLDEAHAISQDIQTAEGSYWHALMHRREPDFGNSKYWFRRVGVHPVYAVLREEAVKLAAGDKWPALLAKPAWDALAFVDLCEAHYDPGAAGHDFCRRVQRAEWELLFDHCYRRAGGT
jgi:hypothetical protein